MINENENEINQVKDIWFTEFARYCLFKAYLFLFTLYTSAVLHVRLINITSLYIIKWKASFENRNID